MVCMYATLNFNPSTNRQTKIRLESHSKLKYIVWLLKRWEGLVSISEDFCKFDFYVFFLFFPFYFPIMHASYLDHLNSAFFYSNEIFFFWCKEQAANNSILVLGSLKRSLSLKRPLRQLSGPSLIKGFLRRWFNFKS